MKAGTIVKLPDGREGTVVYHGLDGDGIKWGRHDVTMADMEGSGGCFIEDISEDYQWQPDVMLRDSYPSANLECVGEEYEIVSVPPIVAGMEE